MTWVTNDPAATRALKAADRQYARELAAAGNLPLTAKIAAIRDARANRAAAYEAIYDHA